jgi:transcription elongation factor
VCPEVDRREQKINAELNLKCEEVWGNGGVIKYAG